MPKFYSGDGAIKSRCPSLRQHFPALPGGGFPMSDCTVCITVVPHHLSIDLALHYPLGNKTLRYLNCFTGGSNHSQPGGFWPQPLTSHLTANHSVCWRLQSDETNWTTSSAKSREANTLHIRLHRIIDEAKPEVPEMFCGPWNFTWFFIDGRLTRYWLNFHFWTQSFSALSMQ